MLTTNNQLQIIPTRGFGRLMLAFAGIALFAFATGGQVSAQPQSQRSLLSRLAQTTDTDPASVAFRTGRDYLDDQQWAKAQEKFSEYLKSYPSDKNVDQALYWLAYSQL